MLRHFTVVVAVLAINTSLLAQAPLGTAGPPLLDPGWTSTSFPKQEWPTSKVPQADALAKQAQQEFNVGSFAAGVALLQKAIELDPVHPYAYWRLGSAQLSVQHDAGLALMKRQTEVAPSPTAFKHAGFILQLGGLPEEAIPFFREGSTKFPEDRELPALLGETLLKVQAYDDAVKVLAAQADRYPNSGRLHLFLGRALLRSGRLEQARPHLIRAAELEPSATMWTMSANTLAEAGADLDRALNLAHQSVSLAATRTLTFTPSEPQLAPERFAQLLSAWAAVARVQLKRGEIADARVHAEAVLEFTVRAGAAILLGQIEDAARNSTAAADAYAKAMAMTGAAGSVPSLDAATRLAQLLPTAAERDAAITGGNQAVSRLRNIPVQRGGDLPQVTAGVAIFLDRSGRVTEVATRGATGPAGAADAILATIVGKTMSRPAPSGPDLKLFRQASLSCAQGQAVCRVFFLGNQTINTEE